MKRLLLLTLTMFTLFSLTHAHASTPDPNFGADGSFPLESVSKFSVADIASSADGSTALVWASDTITMLDSAGELDSSFGEDGETYPIPRRISFLGKNTMSAVAFRGERLLVAGSLARRAIIVRLNSDGTIDKSFGDRGVVLSRGPRTQFEDMVIDRRGRIVVAGFRGPRSSVVSRYLPNGKVDRGFGKQGKVVLPITDRTDLPSIGGLQVTPDGGIVAIEATKSKVRVLRFSRSGSIRRKATIVVRGGQPTYPTSAVSSSGAITGGFVALDPRRHSGNSGEVVTFRLTAAGKLDRRYGNGGIVRFSPKKVARAFGNGSRSYFDSTLGLGSSGRDVTLSTTMYRPGKDRRTITFRLDDEGRVDRSFGSRGAFFTGSFPFTAKLPIFGLSNGGTLITAGGLLDGSIHQQHLYRFSPE